MTSSRQHHRVQARAGTEGRVPEGGELIDAFCGEESRANKVSLRVVARHVSARAAMAETLVKPALGIRTQILDA